MKQEEFDGVAKNLSPCQNVCTLDASGSFCTACKRSIQEIAEWSSYSTAQRLQIMNSLPLRTIAQPKQKPVK